MSSTTTTQLATNPLNGVYFVNSDLTDLATLLAGMPEGAEVVLLDSAQDGLSQMLTALEGRSGLDAIHVIGHGASGMIDLGSTSVTSDTLTERADDVAALGRALSSTGDILLYGCDVGEGEQGATFIAQLAALSGADVAASTNLTGAAALGGDWVLEASTGQVETTPLANYAMQAVLGGDSETPDGLRSSPYTWNGITFQTQYNGSIDNSDPENPLKPDNLWDRYTLSGVADGTVVKVYMGNSSTVDDYIQIGRMVRGSNTVVTQNDDAGDGERSFDAFVSWTYRSGDVIHATTYSSGYRGSYSLWVSVGAAGATAPGVTDIGSAPVATPTAPTFTDSFGALGTVADTVAVDTTLSGFSGTLTATDSTPTGTISFSGGGTQAYGTLNVAAGGAFTFTPNTSSINTLAAGATVTHTYAVTVSDGSLSSSKNLTVRFTGANDLPTLTANTVAMPGILEDAGATSTTNAGTTVRALFGSRFSDVDAGATFKGVYIVSNAAMAGEGEWQYLREGGTTWAAVTATTTLLATDKVHFVPALNWSGTPGALTVKAIDNNDAQSAGTATLAITVAAVNDLPVFTSTAGTNSYADTATYDTSFVATTGTLAASDVDSTLAAAFSVRGATLTTDTWTAQGQYGTLTLNRSTGAWSYMPDKLATINALPEGKTVHDLFDFKVTDPEGGSTTQALDITITGSNDLPVVTSAIVDQSFSGAGSWTYQIPAATFTDAEGAGLLYTVALVTDAGGLTLLDPDAGGALAAGALPSWLTFNETTRTFTGDPDIAWNNQALYLKVTATDPASASVSSVFKLDLTSTANQPPVVSNPLTWHAEATAKEVTAVQFGGGLGGQTVEFASATVTVGTAQTAVEVAAAVVAAGATTSYTVAAKSGSPTTVVYTAKALGDITDTDYANVINTGTYNGTATVAKVADGDAAGTAESFTVTFADNGTGATTIIFNGTTINVTASAVATGVANLVAAGVFTNWNAVQGTTVGTNDNQVTFTQKVVGNVPDVVLATDFTGTYGYTGTTQSGITQGTGYETFEVSYTGGYSGSTLIFDGVTTTAGSALTGEQVATAVTAGTYTGYTDAVKSGAFDTVLFTATASGDQTNVVTGDFTGTYSGSKTVNVTDGGSWSYTVPANTFTDPDNDTLTYTAWTVVGGTPTQIMTTSGANAINFDPASRILSGNGSALPSQTIEIRATDAAGSSTTVSTQFGLYIDDGVDSAVTAGAAIAAQTWTGPGIKTFQIPAGAFVFDDATPDGLVFSATAGGAALPSWLSLDATTGKFSGNPPSDAPASLAIVVTATPQVGTLTPVTSAFTLNIATPNDAPVLTAALADQSVTTTALDLGVIFPANIFSDPDGTTAGTASTASVIYTATLADGTALPAWITYTAATNTFSGNPPGGVPYLNIKVTGTDTGGATAFSTFTLNLQDPAATLSTGALTANNVGVVGITGDSSGTVNEGQTLTAIAPTDGDGRTLYTAVNYQWQVSTNSGATWADIAGTRGQAQTLAPDNSEAGTGKQVRVQAFYTDNGDVAESPVSTAISVANVDDTGGVTLAGGLSAGSVLTATINDNDGLINVTPTYTWQRSLTVGGTYSNISDAADSSAYTVTTDDGDYFIRVVTSYTDNQGTTNTPQATTAAVIMRGAVPPVAGDDTAIVIEASGAANATTGTNVTGTGSNLLTNDTDLNAGDTKTVTEVRLGANEGSGTMASNDASIYTLVGRYGTLTVKMGLSTADGGAYTYTVNQDNDQVNALATGATLLDVFNYQVSDSTLKTDYGLLTVTVTGANDAPTVSGLRESSTVIEDLAGFIRTDMILVDSDLGAGANFALKLSVGTGRLLVSDVSSATTVGITIKGADTGTLTLTGNMSDISGWLQGTVIKYAAAANVLGANSATLTLSANDGGGFNTLGTMAINVSPANDAPRLDLDANNSSISTGDNFITTFRPRGEAVKVVDSDVTITDTDAGDTLASATVAITAGDLDNEFGTIFEVLTASGGNSYAGSLGTITVSGNGTKALTLTGAGTHADYQNLLKTISYVNNNPNAYSGDRTITISVTDVAQIKSVVGAAVTDATTFTVQTANTDIVAGLHIIKNGVDTGLTVLSVSGANISVTGSSTFTLTLATTDTLAFASSGAASGSNLGSFTANAANTAITVGQKIYLGGTDTGQTVAVVIDSTHFVASGPISGLTPTSALTFATTAAVSAAVTSATSFTVETANNSIATGQHIYRNGVDTGFTVSAVSGSSITSSAAITLAVTDVLSFQTSTTNSAPLAATTTVRVPWTSVVDMDGTATASRDYATSYTEGAQPIAIATSTASIDNQAIAIKVFTVTLDNPLDGAAGASEELSISASMAATLLTKGITATVATDKHSISFTTGSSGAAATDMQLGLRAIKYINNDQNPSITPRVISTYVLDLANELGVNAKTTINIVPVNDAPVKGGSLVGALNEGELYVFSNTTLYSTDVDNAPGTLKYILTSLPTTTQGTLFRDSNNNGVVDAGEALGATTDTNTLAKISAIGSNAYFTQSEVTAGQIKYLQSGINPNGTNATGTDTFGFKVVDGMEDYAFTNIEAYQTGSVVLTVTEVNDAPTGSPTITGTLTPGQVLTANTSSLADADGLASTAFTYQWQTSSNGATWTNATGTGATANAYMLAAADQGLQVKVVVSVKDAFNRTSDLSSTATANVAITNTAGTGLTITNDGTPAVGEVLTANTSTIVEPDGLGPFTYQWQASTLGTTGWADVVSATAKTYTPVSGDAGKFFRVVASYTDGRGNAEVLQSPTTGAIATATVDGSNHAPVLTGDGAFPATTALFSNVVVSTVETGQKITTLILTITGLQDGADEKLTVDGVQLGIAATTGATAITYLTTPPTGTLGGVSYAISITSGTATITLTHAGLTETQTKTLVENLTFANLAAAPSTGLRVVTLMDLTDDAAGTTGGTASGAIGLSATVDIGTTLPSSNNTPTVTANTVATVNEGGVVTLVAANLTATDAEQPNGLTVALTSTPTNGTLFRDLNGNGIRDGAETALIIGSKFALADIAANRIKYLHNGTETAADSFTFQVTDGLAVSDSDTGTTGDQAHTFNITVTGVNDAPTLTATPGGSTAAPVVFTEGDASKAMFSGTATSAVETAQNITELKVSVSGLRDGVNERLFIDSTAIALTSATTSGTTTTAGIGYAVSITGGTATVTFTKAATAADWNGYIDGLAYENASQNPTAGQRAITLVNIKDVGAGLDTTELAITSRVSVTPVNDVPTLTTPGITVIEGGSLTLTTTDLAAADAETALSGLTYTLSTAPTYGTVYLDLDGNGIRNTGEALAALGSFTHEQLTSGKVRYEHGGAESGDSMGLTVSDGAATSTAITMEVTRTAANDAPVITNLGSDVLSYPTNSGAKTLEQGANAVVTDEDSSTFSGGNLRVSVSFNRDPGHDVLSVQNVGVNAGQISVGTGTVSYANTQIGTLTGGTGTADLVVTFNSAATPAAVSALVKAIQFSNDQAAPALTSRTVSFTLNDGGVSGQAAPVSVNVNLLSGLAPSISIGNGFFVVENIQLVTALSATDPASRPITFSVDSTVDVANNPDQAKFEIISGNLLRFKAAPDYETPGDVGEDNVYNVIVKASNDLGSTATQALTITVLDQNPEDGVAVGDTAGPVFRFATVNANTLTITYTDASNLDADKSPATGAFAVQVAGSPVAVTGVAINSTTKTATLTLASAVSNGQAVTLAYTDPTAGNDANALQDAIGNDAATLVATAVNNITPGVNTGGGGSGGSGGVTPAPVTDNDGIPDSIENAIPGLPMTGGGSSVAGDGNGDGVADSQQSAVTSLPFLNTMTAQSNPGAALPLYITLVAGSNDGKVDATDPTTHALSNVKQLDAPTDLPSNIKMPLGLISFSSTVSLSGVTGVGMSETFSLYVDPSLGANAYLKQDATGTWVNLASSEYGGKVVSEGGKTRLDFQITDGGEFDADHTINGVIVDPGAVGFSTAVSNDTDRDQFPDTLEAANGLTVGVKDNDVFTSSKLFAMQMYRDILYREGEGDGIQFWQDRLDAGVSRAEVAISFLDSPEFQSGTGAVARLYFGSLGRLPDALGMSFWMDQQQLGTPLSQIADAFAISPEFTLEYAGLGNTAFIESQYQSALGRSATVQEQTQWGTQLAAGASRGVVLLGLTESIEYKVASDAKVSVALDYLGLLGRPAEQAGFDYWANLQSAGVPEITLVGGFIASPEFHDRFLE